MKLNLDSIAQEKSSWLAAGVALPKFDIAAMREATAKAPEWVHFGAGNIFRGFIGSLSQRLLNEGLAKTGIIACDTFDYEVIEKIYDAHDNLTLNVLLNPDGTTTREVLAGVAQGLKANFTDEGSVAQLKAIFRAPSLKMLSFTITEIIAHNTARNLHGKLKAALESVIFGLAVQILFAGGRFHSNTQGQFKGIDAIIGEGDSGVGMVVEKKADTHIIAGQKGILSLYAQRNVGIHRFGNENIPGVFYGIITPVEHESQTQFSAIPKTETAPFEHRTVYITVKAVDIAHTRPVHGLHASKAVKLKAHAHLRVLAKGGEGRGTVIGPAHPGIQGKECRDLFAEKVRIKTTVI